MPIDSSIILAARPQPLTFQDPMELYGKSLALKGLIGQQELQGLQMQQTRRGIADDEAVRTAYQQSGGDPATLRALLSKSGQYKAANEFDKALLEREGKQTTIDKDKATTDKTRLEIFQKKMEESANGLIGVRDRQGAAAWKLSQFDDPVIGPVLRKLGKTPEGSLAEIPQDEARLPEWIQQNALGMKKFMEGATGRAAEQRQQQNALVGPDGRTNETAVQARERIARAGDPTRIAIANANLQAGAQTANAQLGPQDQITAPQVGAPGIAAPQPQRAPGAFPSVAPAAQAASDAQAVDIIAQKYLGSAQEMAQIDANIANAQNELRNLRYPEQRGLLERDLRGMLRAKELSGAAPAATPTPAAPVDNRSARERAKGPKEVPATGAAKILENQTNLRLAERALSLVQGANVGSAKGDTDATGVKGFLPDAVLQRVDQKGVDARAAIANLGSMVIHDRSGAAVTAAEFPRLQPFIPSARDSAETVQKKLRGFVDTYREEIEAAKDYYKSAGFKVPASGAAAPAPSIAPPKLGERKDGYIYRGGDPSQRGSWEKER